MYWLPDDFYDVYRDDLFDLPKRDDKKTEEEIFELLEQ